MSHEPERERGREQELQKAIAGLRKEVEDCLNMEVAASERRLLLVMSRVVSVISSEYGTIMRILDRQDEAAEARTKMIENLFGKNPGDEDCIAAKVNHTYNALRSIKRVGMAVILALAVLVATKWYEGIKLNEIIAAQKVQAAKP